MKQFTFRTLLIITFFVAATALTLSLRLGEPSPISPREAELQRELDALEQRIEDLTGKLAAVREEDPLPGFVAETPHPPPPVETSVNSTTAARVAEIGETMEDVRWTMTLRGMMPPTADHIDRSRSLLFDPNADLREQLAALRILRTSDQLTDDDVRQMVKIFNQTDNEKARVEIIRRLDNVRTPEFLDTLMIASSTSDNAKVRAEAIDSLSGYLPDPDLKDWLTVVSRDDPNKKVQREANRLLEKYWPKVEDEG
ncbi:MAG: HEAT repeat domain-containing protein [Opitutaceae bacterium]